MQLAPDLCAPGVQIYAAGYGTGNDKRLSFGEASGTSMACPQAAGGSALVLAKHPEFTPSEVTSALMSTANYINILDHDGTPGQPLEIGAGRIDLARAVDPVLFLDPPSLSFSLVSMDAPAGSISKTFSVRSYENASMTFTVRAVHHTGRGSIENAPSWVRVEPSTIHVDSSEDIVNITVYIDTTKGTPGDEQGYILIENATGDEVAHLPYWARVTFKESERVDFYIIDADQSSCSSSSTTDYLKFYTSALDEAGLTYKTWEYCEENDSSIPAEALALKSRVVLLFTGDVIVDLSNRDGELREIMHARIPVIQMGEMVGYSWGLTTDTHYGESPNMKYEFEGAFNLKEKSIKKIKAADGAPSTFSSISSSASCTTRPLIWDSDGKTFLVKDKNDYVNKFIYRQ